MAKENQVRTTTIERPCNIMYPTNAMTNLKTFQHKVASFPVEITHNLGSPTNFSTDTRSNCKSFVCLIIAHKLCSCAASQIFSDGHLNLGTHEQRYMVISIGFPQKWYLMVRFADLWPSQKSSHLGREMWNLQIYGQYLETSLYKSTSFPKTRCFWWSPR